MTQSEYLFTWLQKTIAEVSQGARLPSVNQLCEQFKMSRVTVLRVISKFKENGQLQSIRGRGIFAGVQVPIEIKIEQPMSSKNQLEEFLIDLLNRGILKHGQRLPLVKALASEQKVAQSTVIKAYASLSKQGRIEKKGKGFYVSQSEKGIRDTHRYQIPFYIFDYVNIDTIFLHHTFGSLFQKMENELLDYGISLQFRNYSQLPSDRIRWSKKKNIPRGIIIYSLDSSHASDAFNLIKSIIYQQNKINSNVLICGNTRQKNKEKNVHVLMPGSLPNMRIQAISNYIVTESFQNIVMYFENEKMDMVLFLEQARLWAELKKRNFRISMKYCVISNQRQYSTEQFLSQSTGPNKKSLFHETKSWLEREVPQVNYSEFLDSIHFLKSTARYFSEIERTAKRSLCVFDFDQNAIELKYFCDKNRIQIPQEIAILSQENNPSNIHQGISNCINDSNTIGYQMAHAIIGDIPVAKTSNGYLRLNSRLLHRLTT